MTALPPCCGQGGSQGAEAPIGLARCPPRFALLLAAPRAEAGLGPACSRPGRCRGWKAGSTSAALARSPWELLRKLRNLPLSASRALFACLCYRLSTDPKVQTPCIGPPAPSSSPRNPALTHAGQRGAARSLGVLALLWLGAGFSLVSPLPGEAVAQTGEPGAGRAVLGAVCQPFSRAVGACSRASPPGERISLRRTGSRGLESACWVSGRQPAGNGADRLGLAFFPAVPGGIYFRPFPLGLVRRESTSLRNYPRLRRQLAMC